MNLVNFVPTTPKVIPEYFLKKVKGAYSV